MPATITYLGKLIDLKFMKSKRYSGPAVSIQFDHGTKPVEQKLGTKVFLLGEVPPGMFLISVKDDRFGVMAHQHWADIEASAKDWWWTYYDKREKVFGFVFRSELDALMYASHFAAA